MMRLRRMVIAQAQAGEQPIFSLSWPQSVPSNTSSSSSAKRFFTPCSYIVGMSPEGYYRTDGRVNNVAVSDSGVSFLAGAATGYGVAFVLNVEAGKTYRFALSMTNGNAWLLRYGSDGSNLGYARAVNSSITIASGTSQALWVLVSTAGNQTSTFTNLSVTEVV